MGIFRVFHHVFNWLQMHFFINYSFDDWKSNLIYCIHLCQYFLFLLQDNLLLFWIFHSLLRKCPTEDCKAVCQGLISKRVMITFYVCMEEMQIKPYASMVNSVYRPLKKVMLNYAKPGFCTKNMNCCLILSLIVIRDD